MKNYTPIKWTMDEMDKFLEMYNFPILNQGEIDTMNRPIINNESEINTTTHNNLKKTSPGQDGFTGEFYQLFKKTTTYPFPTIQKLEQEGMLPNSFNEINSWLCYKDQTKISKNDYRLISLININAKILNKVSANWIQ